ncbi:Predicted amidohydrolase [Thermoanaerobacter uzonensis DSM 18761]|uniref:Predicted amidohydrolase n=1 Tax=Thermoanaerobacter uzonensis DSM 18761 TaxID=1123369 RepID=A0A1M4XKN9_9THEO|nr:MULTISPECIES: nitrilase-related carbon-nitrogen hydrolase [Thermoanaerobacter]KHO61843.1 nitrilase [Thermoanaerobacter sp. YS13]SHE93928.1 Predicted amidohydrolase [Thermoanaerobacter uzonensis DSM 18761]
MRVASVVLKKGEVEKITGKKEVLNKIDEILKVCQEKGACVVVFPALTGMLWDFEDKFLEEMKKISLKYKDIAICPGSFFEKDGDKTYHSSFLLLNGEVILFQRQLYLAKWERDIGLSRGSILNIAEINGFKVSIILSTDVFYPQVARYAALKGVNLVISPVAIRGDERNYARQIAGLWQNVQQNLFFAVESGFKGECKGYSFYSESAIHGPLEMTRDDDGFLAKEDDFPVIVVELDERARKEAISKFDVLKQLNTEFYKRIFG